MRKQPTKAERKLWQQLRRKQIHGVKFRRQVVIDQYIVDFCSLSIRLVIEVDGPSHEFSQEADTHRQRILESLGFEVLRFNNAVILDNIDGVTEEISDIVGRMLTPP